MPDEDPGAPAPDDNEPELFELNDVEIFRTGIWNGDTYTISDLDEMIRNFGDVGFRPPIKLGHAEKSGDPAFGWVASLKRVGDRLLANFSDMPKEIFEAVKARRFDAVSSEIFWNLKRGGQTFKRALKAVALLGAETPAVAGLKPLRENFSDDDLRLVHVYTIQEGTPMPNDDLDALQAELEKLKLHNQELKESLKAQSSDDDATALKIAKMRDEIAELRRAKSEAEEENRIDRIERKVSELKVPSFREHVHALYDLATRARSTDGLKTVKFSVDDEDGHKVSKDTSPVEVIDDLVQRLNNVMDEVFLKEHTHSDKRRASDDGDEDAGLVIDKKAKRYMAENGEKDYSVALHAVLEDPDNADIARAYINRGRVQ